MFRIKQVRNTTVAKQSHIGTVEPIKVVVPGGKGNGIRQPVQNRVRLKPAMGGKHREAVVRGQGREGRVQAANRVKVNIKHPLLTHKQKKEGQKEKVQINERATEEIQKNYAMLEEKKEEYTGKVNINTTISKQSQTIPKESFDILVVSQERSNCQASLPLLQKNKNDFQIGFYMQQEQAKHQIQQKELQRQKEQQERKRKELQKEAKCQQEAQQMIEKVQARRKVRQAERQRKKKHQEQVRKQQQMLERDGVGGLISMADALSHVEISQAMMDAQVRLILKMNFANYPNKQVIQRQVQELERIDQSYHLVREDPKNPLLKGLANFRIELFNRVGQLVMEGQANMDTTENVIQMIPSDSRNCPNLPGLSITRGLTGNYESLLTVIKSKEQAECLICLQEIPVNSEACGVKCGHFFHRNCLAGWLESTANCPACRYNIKFDHF